MDSILEVRNVSKAYEGFALENVSFSLPRGYIMGLIGPNGAGKTTLLRMMLDLARPDRGDLKLFGMDSVEDGVAIRTRVGFVHEHPTFYQGLSGERVAGILGSFYPSWNEDEFRRLAGEFGVPLNRKLKTYSQGMRIRFALAAALSHQAELLLLDEPSSGLDPAFRRDLLHRLSGVIEGGRTSVLFSTHLTSDLDRVADYITFLRDGQLQFTSPKDDVLDRYRLVKGDASVFTPSTRGLFSGMVEGEFGWVGLTEDIGRVQAELGEAEIVVDRASLEDVVYYTGRTGEGGMKLHVD